MRISLRLGYFAGASAAIMLCAGCSSATTAAPGSAGAPTDNGATTQSVGLRAAATSVSVLPARLQKLVRPGHFLGRGFGHAGTCPSAPVAFVSDGNNNVVYEIDGSGSVCATLTGFNGPQGLSTDKSGDLYVANTDASDIVEIAPPYTGSPVNVYADPNGFPSDVAVDGDGNLAVPNIESTSGGPGDIVFYTPGSPNPTRTVSGSTYTSPRFCAFDSRGDLLIDDIDLFNTGQVNLGAILPGRQGHHSADHRKCTCVSGRRSSQ